MNLRELIEQASPKERKQFKAYGNWYLDREIGRQRRKAVAEARTKEELGINNENES